MITLDGVDYGTADEIAEQLGPDVTDARVRDWGRRAADPNDPLYGKLDRHHRPGRGRGTTWFRLDQAAAVERITRLNGAARGGPRRRSVASSASS